MMEPFRSSDRMYSMKTSVLKNVAIFTGKHQCWGLIFIREKETPTEALTREY